MKKANKERINKLEEKIKSSNKLLRELIEFMERTAILPSDEGVFSTWETELTTLRVSESKQRHINEAKSILKNAGFLVAEHENELDAAKLKKWLDQPDLKIKPALNK